jgi:hypothetical protein
MQVSLRPHPDSSKPSVSTIVVTVERRGNVLSLTYAAEGDISAIAVPAHAAPARADDLWKHTCFEAFVRAEGAGGYLEFNMSPSGQWAAYRFDGYRAGMRNEDIGAPRLAFEDDERGLSLIAEIDLSRLPEAGRAWDVNITAIIENKAGTKAFWALAHAPGKPDFHNADCFVGRVPPA